MDAERRGVLLGKWLDPQCDLTRVVCGTAEEQHVLDACFGAREGSLPDLFTVAMDCIACHLVRTAGAQMVNRGMK